MSYTKCHECNRGGNGNAKDKCACGWKREKESHLGCYCGSPIEGEIKPKPKISRSKARYKKYLEVSDCYESFAHYLGIKMPDSYLRDLKFEWSN